jgi:hypothetical protein
MSKIFGDSLPPEALAILKDRLTTTVVATVSPDGFPNTTPIHLLTAKDPKTLLMAMAKRHRGTHNIKENGHVMVCFCEQGDVNVSIKGTAKVVKEPMDCNSAMCVVQVDITEVKDDSTHSRTTTGIRYQCMSPKSVEFIAGVVDELEKM